MTVTDHAPIDFNPTVSPHREDPHLFYRAARQRPPVLSPTLGAYLVTRYADLVTVIDDPDTYSFKAALPMIYANPPEVVAALERGGVPETTMVVNEDEPEHVRFRRVFDAGFTGARVRAMLPTMRACAAELADGFQEGHADLVADYAVPFVQTVISAIIGFPPEDTARIQAWTDDFVLLWSPLAPVEPRVEAAKRMADYTRYLQALIEDRRAHPFVTALARRGFTPSTTGAGSWATSRCASPTAAGCCRSWPRCAISPSSTARSPPTRLCGAPWKRSASRSAPRSPPPGPEPGGGSGLRSPPAVVVSHARESPTSTSGRRW